MIRKALVVGDPPICGGRVLPYEPPFACKLDEHQVALIGGRVYCEGCNSVGIIGKAGGPYRARYIAEMALEGDVCICHCPCPQPIKATLQSRSTCDDRDGSLSKFIPEMLEPGHLLPVGSRDLQFANKKQVDDVVKYPPEAEITENICPNMTNKQFATLAMRLRDMAVDYVVEKRLPELRRWDHAAQSRARMWFGAADENIRQYLHQGLTACLQILHALEPKNFVRYVEGGKLATCVMGSAIGVAAAVCKPDSATRTIAIALDFCTLEHDNKINFSTGEVMDGDSRLLTLIHEVTHFDDAFGSFDHWYSTRESRSRANDQAKARSNADSLAAYILGVAP